MYEVKVKNILQKIKNENAKIIKKIDVIMHSKLLNKEIKITCQRKQEKEIRIYDNMSTRCESRE